MVTAITYLQEPQVRSWSVLFELNITMIMIINNWPAKWGFPIYCLTERGVTFVLVWRNATSRLFNIVNAISWRNNSITFPPQSVQIISQWAVCPSWSTESDFPIFFIAAVIFCNQHKAEKYKTVSNSTHQQFFLYRITSNVLKYTSTK